MIFLAFLYSLYFFSCWMPNSVFVRVVFLLSFLLSSGKLFCKSTNTRCRRLPKESVSSLSSFRQNKLSIYDILNLNALCLLVSIILFTFLSISPHSGTCGSCKAETSIIFIFSFIPFLMYTVDLWYFPFLILEIHLSMC